MLVFSYFQRLSDGVRRTPRRVANSKRRVVGVRFAGTNRLKAATLLTVHCSASRVPDTRRICGPSVIARRETKLTSRPVFGRQNELMQKSKTDLFRKDRRPPFKCWHVAVNYRHHLGGRRSAEIRPSGTRNDTERWTFTISRSTSNVRKPKRITTTTRRDETKLRISRGRKQKNALENRKKRTKIEANEGEDPVDTV